MAENSQPSTKPLVNLFGISVTFHMGDIEIPVLRGVSVQIRRGELVALMGASGSGKSTLMNVLGCLSRPTTGSYTLDGIEVSTLSRDARARLRNERIGFVFQNFQLLPRTTALEQVMMPLDYSPTQISAREARDRATGLLERVGLADRLHHLPNQMSGGQQQRVAIARALINRPSILFSDEPTGNLDSNTGATILEMLRELSRSGSTIVLVTHDNHIAAQAARRIEIRDGKIENDTMNAPQPAAV